MLNRLRTRVRDLRDRFRRGLRTVNEWEVAMAAQQRLKPATDTGVGKGAVGPVSVIVLALVFFALTIGLLFALWLLWPPTPTENAEGVLVPVKNYGPFQWNVEQNMLLLIAILGALGSMGYVLRSYAKYVGERNLLWSWIPLYF